MTSQPLINLAMVVNVLSNKKGDMSRTPNPRRNEPTLALSVV